MILAGVVIGTGVSAVATFGLTRFLHQVAPTDPLTLLVVVAILVAVGLLAMAIPARRATRVDPVTALRAE